MPAKCHRMIGRHGIEALTLGSPELPLILTRHQFGLPFLNRTAVHARPIL
jgi:aspartate/glutamate racemase